MPGDDDGDLFAIIIVSLTLSCMGHDWDDVLCRMNVHALPELVRARDWSASRG